MRMTQRFANPLVVALALLAVAVSPSFAVTDEEIFRDFRFNFINPGGRSLGMGGAFVSLADDATAALANPAGLTQLAKPEFFGEYRFAKVDTSRTDQFLDLTDISREQTIVAETQPSSVTNPSFLSYVYPWDKVSLGFSRQELISSRSRTSNFFQTESTTGTPPDNIGILESPGTVSLRLVNYNVSVGWKIHETFSVGATMSYGQLTLESGVSNLITDYFADPDDIGIEMWNTLADGSDTDVTFSGGVLWAPMDRLSFGAVYRQGGDFAVGETISSNQSGTTYESFVDSLFNDACGASFPADGMSCSFPNEFHIPESYAVGVSWRPIDSLILALDAVTINYSDLIEGFQTRLNVLNFLRSEDQAQYTVDDQTNIHFGLEYVLTAGETPVALRAGYHQDKDNRLRADFPDLGASSFFFSNNDTFPGRDDIDHFTAGVGFVIGDNFQFDLGVDYSTETTEAVTSFIHRF